MRRKKLELRNPACRLCELWHSAETPCMWGNGPRNPSVMVIGDYPNDAEDQAGKPAQGRSAAFLRGLLSKAKIDPAQVYFTQGVRCKPPEGRSPTPKEVKTCAEYLHREIADIKPQAILTLGANPIKTLIKGAKITEVHGQPLEYEGVPLLATFSPTLGLRDPSKVDLIERDLRKFAAVLKGEMPTLKHIHNRIIWNMNDWAEFLCEYQQFEAASVDIETTGLDRFAPGAAVNMIQIGLPNLHNWCLPLAHAQNPWKRFEQESFLRQLVDLAENKIIIGHNFKFDNLWLEAIYKLKFYLRFDTMLASHLLDENNPHGLKELASRYCDAPAYDVDTSTKKGEGSILELALYGCYDVYYTLQLYFIFKAKLVADSVLRRLFFRITMPVARMFEEIESEGLYVDMKKLENSEQVLTRRLARITNKMNTSVGRDVDWNSTKQIGDLFYQELKLPVLEYTPTGKPSTAETVLNRLQHIHPVAKELVAYRGTQKVLSTYIKGWQESIYEGRLYLSTKLHGTVTGRYSSRLHQVPRDPTIRSLISAPESSLFVSADYSQIELRLAAILSGDARMKAAFQAGEDLHSLTASLLLAKAIADLTKDERTLAKAINFGLLYGMGWNKLVLYARDTYGVHMTDAEAQNFRKRFFEVYSSLPVWHERQRRCVRALGQVSSLSGRIRHLPGVNSSDKMLRAEAERQAINSPVQGFGSGDLKAMAMLEINETFPRTQVKIKGEVHDSILMEIVKKEDAPRLLPKIKQIMESPKLLDVFKINLTVPIVVDIDVGPWGKGVAYGV